MRRDHPPSHMALVADPPRGVHTPSSSPEGARGGHVVHGPRIGAPGPTRTLHRAGPGIRVVHPRAPVLDRPQIAVTAPVPAGEIECRRPPRWSQSSGTSSAVSRRTAGVRQIAAAIALMARGSNGPAHAQPLADHRPHNAIMAHVHHSRPQRPGQTQNNLPGSRNTVVQRHLSGPTARKWSKQENAAMSPTE